MARVKTGTTKRARHKKVLSLTEGYRGAKSRLVRTAHEAMLHAGEYAFAGRKGRKRDFRELWIERIGAGLKESESELSYSRFINSLKKANIQLDRKVLADLALNDKETFKSVLAKLEA